MLLLLLAFVPVLMLVVLANLGEGYRWARRLTYALLLMASLLIFLTGVIAPLEMLEAQLPAGLDANFNAARLWLSLTGALSALSIGLTLFLAHRMPNQAEANAAGRGLCSRVAFKRWARPVHLTALTLVILYTGVNLAQAALISDPSALLEGGFQLGVGELAAQAAGFVALALLGVGLGMRRSWPEALERLKLRGLSIGEVMTAFWLTILLVVGSGLGGAVLMLLSPQDLSEADAFNQIIIAAFSSPLGAIVLGLLSGVSEEMLYRGALQPAFGLVLTSFIFAFHHIQYLNPTLLLIVALGLAFGWMRNRWSTTMAALVHAGYNATLVLLTLAAASTVGG
ncbi:MAG: CPBP family intramembrane metalloprotease [Chloroflexi bacterium]|nr:CPBP family intramembrane metalloprotease [Chloroflexota bacterium]